MNFPESKYCMIYITCKDETEALQIGKLLIQKKLSPCANVIDSMKSIFHWKGEILFEKEAILILKTRFILFDKICQEVKSIHSYETPCILAYPILAGEKDYLTWIDQETKESE